MNGCYIVTTCRVARISVWCSTYRLSSGQYPIITSSRNLTEIQKLTLDQTNGFLLIANSTRKLGLYQPVLFSAVGKCYWLIDSGGAGTVSERKFLPLSSRWLNKEYWGETLFLSGNISFALVDDYSIQRSMI